MVKQAAVIGQIEGEARQFLADAMREPHETYPPIFSTFVSEGVPTAGGKVTIDTAVTAIAFAIMAGRAPVPLPCKSGEGSARLTPIEGVAASGERENNLPACTTCGAPAGLDCRTGQGRIPPCLGREQAAHVKWCERWYGSEPQKGSAIVDEQGNLVAYFGGDKTTHKATTAAVSAHNAAFSPPSPAIPEGTSGDGVEAINGLEAKTGHVDGCGAHDGYDCDCRASETGAVLLVCARLLDQVRPRDGSALAVQCQQAVKDSRTATTKGLPTLTPDPTHTREAELRGGIMRAALCLSGFAGEGIVVDGFDDPADVYGELVNLVGLPDADDDDLRAALNARAGA